ncbi:MAG: alpha-L-fucosidase [Bacteroidota bacterium]|nr:alpha-L-fucosidase [Bacteroidota bacterium]
MKRTQWWRNARFGMFIHFGAYAVAARGEWVKSNEHLTTQQYQKYVDEFNPVDFDAKKWAKAAKAAGMKYAVLTAKHHDGFCMFDSKLTDYKISTRFKGRDLVREFLDAFRAEGIKVGLYYSLIDWHHPDYPNVGNHPQRNDKEYGKRKFDWDNYLKYMHGQVEELVKNYGKIDIMWFDYSFDDYNGEKWKAKELVDMVRKYQPDIILDNRLEINHNMGAAERMVSSYGDFETPEQGIPDAPLFDKYGNPIPWETCLTMNDSWGYNESDKNWKSPELIIQSLVNCVSKSGNMLLNVGPNARGNFPEESLHILREVGNWMNKNSESIYGCKASDLAKPEWGRYTQNGNTIYAHWMYPYLGHLKVSGLNDKVKNIYLLSSGAELHYQSTLWNNNEAGNVFIPLNPNTRKYDAVIKIVTKD